MDAIKEQKQNHHHQIQSQHIQRRPKPQFSYCEEGREGKGFLTGFNSTHGVSHQSAASATHSLYTEPTYASHTLFL